MPPNRRGRSVFLFVNVMDAHEPYKALPPWDDLFAPEPPDYPCSDPVSEPRHRQRVSPSIQPPAAAARIQLRLLSRPTTFHRILPDCQRLVLTTQQPV